jgi:hypothetical protein
MGSVMKVLGISAKKPQIAGFQIQSSVYGIPVPIVYGRARISGNLIHMPAQPRPVKQSGGGKGKGGSGAKGGKSPETYNYVGPVAIGLCEGPISSLRFVWQDKQAKQNFSTYQTNGWTLFTGTSSQSPWSYLTTNFPAEAVPYQFTAYVAHSAASFPGNMMSQFGWEVNGFEQNYLGVGVPDANPADIVEDLLTNVIYGANFPSALLYDLTDFRDYCAAAGLFASPAVSSQQPGRDHLNELYEISNTAAVWSDGVLKHKPYGDIPLTGNGHSYTPDTTPLYNLGDNDFLPMGSSLDAGDQGDEVQEGSLDPIIIHRTEISKAYNQVTVRFADRAYDYNPDQYRADYDAAVALYGPIPMPALDLPAIKTQEVAQQVAQIRLQREQNVRTTYNFNLGWKYSLLEPMDLVTLTDSGLGLSLTPVRITSVTELPNEAGFAITAEDWPFGTANAALYDSGSASGSMPDMNIDPGDTSTPCIIESPKPLLQSSLDILIGATGGDDWGGCEVWISTDDVTFTKVGSIVGKAAYGVLSDTLATDPSWPAVDTTHTLGVDISASGRTMEDFSETDFDNLVPLCKVGSEWVAYRDATLTGVGLYDLTRLYRGLYNSPIPASHSIGEEFAFIDNTFLRLPWPKGYAGQTLYFKLPAFNIYGAALQQLADVSSFTYTVENDPILMQDPIAQGTVAIDEDGNWSATADGASGTKSFKYLSSTSAYPSDASVISGGTMVNGRSFSITSGGTLAFGETVYITLVPYSYPDAVGTPGPSIHIRGSYQSYTNTKNVTYSVGSYRPIDNFDFNVSGDQATVVSPTVLRNYGFQTLVLVPVGATVTNVEHDLYRGSTTNATSCTFVLWKSSGGGGAGVVASGAAAANLGWQSISDSTSDLSAGQQYYMESIQGFSGAATPLETAARTGGFVITYTTPTPDTDL